MPSSRRGPRHEENEVTPSELRQHAVATLVAASGLSDFAAALIRRARANRPLDAAALAEIEAVCIQDAKNSEPLGLSLEDDAAAVREGIEILRYYIEAANAGGRQIDEP